MVVDAPGWKGWRVFFRGDDVVAVHPDIPDRAWRRSGDGPRWREHPPLAGWQVIDLQRDLFLRDDVRRTLRACECSPELPCGFCTGRRVAPPLPPLLAVLETLSDLADQEAPRSPKAPPRPAEPPKGHRRRGNPEAGLGGPFS